MNAILSETARQTTLVPLLANGWAMVPNEDAIRKEFKFVDFIEAFGWMSRVALWAEKWNHHPDWSNSFNRVTVTLKTHRLNGLSAQDLKLARKMDRMAGLMGL